MVVRCQVLSDMRWIFMKAKILLVLGIVLLALVDIQASQVTNEVRIATNLVFFLTGEHQTAPQEVFASDELICRTLALESPGTNAMYYRAMPPGQNYLFKLCSKDGAEVKKTQRGVAMSVPPIAPSGLDELLDNYKPQVVRHYEPRALFRPKDMFLIETNGVYVLEVRIVLCVPMTNGVVNMGAMADVYKFARCHDFGLLVSKPLRVRVTKK